MIQADTSSRRSNAAALGAAGYSVRMRLIASLRASSRSPFLQVVKTSIAAILAWVTCMIVLNQPLPIFAAIAALLVVAPSVNQSVSKGIERSIGVIVGVLLAYAAGYAFGHSTIVVLSVIVISLLLAWAFRLSLGSANQIPISAMLVLALGLQTPGYAVNRIIETVIGAAIGLLVNVLVIPPVLFRPAHAAVTGLATEIAALLRDLAEVLRTPSTMAEVEGVLLRARTLRGLRDAAAESALTLSDCPGSATFGAIDETTGICPAAMIARMTVGSTKVTSPTRPRSSCSPSTMVPRRVAANSPRVSPETGCAGAPRSAIILAIFGPTSLARTLRTTSMASALVTRSPPRNSLGMPAADSAAEIWGPPPCTTTGVTPTCRR